MILVSITMFAYPRIVGSIVGNVTVTMGRYVQYRPESLFLVIYRLAICRGGSVPIESRHLNNKNKVYIPYGWAWTASLGDSPLV
ncbi:MAG: hypothetical protein KJ658_05190 [Proteobacteria bacterium]|nr:hypothetical protein [Desulfobacula sp.]MBU3951513.1 hypothetical protein [Pseudomonadota bacterium]